MLIYTHRKEKQILILTKWTAVCTFANGNLCISNFNINKKDETRRKLKFLYWKKIRNFSRCFWAFSEKSKLGKGTGFIFACWNAYIIFAAVRDVLLLDLREAFQRYMRSTILYYRGHKHVGYALFCANTRFPSVSSISARERKKGKGLTSYSQRDLRDARRDLKVVASKNC